MGIELEIGGYYLPKPILGAYNIAIAKRPQLITTDSIKNSQWSALANQYQFSDSILELIFILV